MDISVVGLGKLGAPLTALLASKGHNVIGADVNRSVVDMVNAGIPPVEEAGLLDLMRQSSGRLRATADVDEAIQKTDFTFIIVPTPSDRSGAFSSGFVTASIERKSVAFSPAKRAYHIARIEDILL